jgi:tRNA threonylcarbamoyladenosine biosynthesis protein TsaB
VYILGIDTTNEQAKLCLYNAENKEFFIKTITDKQVSVNLIIEISGLLNDFGVLLSEVNSIAVNIGPGSFTGLRVGISVAKGLSNSIKIPLLGISLFEAMANLVEVKDRKVYLAKNMAKKGICWQILSTENVVWEDAEIQHSSLEEFINTVESDSIIYLEDNFNFNNSSNKSLNISKIESDNVIFSVCQIAHKNIDLPNKIIPIYI